MGRKATAAFAKEPDQCGIGGGVPGGGGDGGMASEQFRSRPMHMVKRTPLLWR